MNGIQRVTGMQDVLPDERRYWNWVTETAADLAKLYGFERIEIPILEYTGLFERGVGTASDFFVQKEMYTIEEPDGSSITLRPEFTAGFVRAYIENGMMNWPQPVKLYTIGPAFRRERPQAGRYRQHTQFNAEILGETDPAADAEMMLLARRLFQDLGYKSLVFQINSTGCPRCKPGYVAALRDYLKAHETKLADVDLRRLQLNPLRVLDSKEPGMEELLADAPHIVDYLCEDCAAHFADLRRILDAVDLKYHVNFRLVRGIDYYTKTVFEPWDQAIGAQASLGGAGRYDGLAEAIGGPPTPGVGFGLGIERIIIGLQQQGIEPPTAQRPVAMVVHFGGETKLAAIRLVEKIRDGDLSGWLSFARERRSMKSQMREVNKRDVRYAVILGEDELARNLATIRSMQDGSQTEVPLDEVVSWLQAAVT